MSHPSNEISGKTRIAMILVVMVFLPLEDGRHQWDREESVDHSPWSSSCSCDWFQRLSSCLVNQKQKPKAGPGLTIQTLCAAGMLSFLAAAFHLVDESSRLPPQGISCRL